jgi:hypothetical protein
MKEGSMNGNPGQAILSEDIADLARAFRRWTGSGRATVLEPEATASLAVVLDGWAAQVERLEAGATYLATLGVASPADFEAVGLDEEARLASLLAREKAVRDAAARGEVVLLHAEAAR